jgi:hypothetical protein
MISVRMATGEQGMRMCHVLCLAAVLLSGCAAPKDAREAAPTGGQETAQAQGAVRRADGSYVLAAPPAVTAGAQAFELVLPSCGKATCALRVRLVEGGRARDSAAVDWESVVQPPQRSEQSAAVIGVGDPLQLGGTLATWQTGEGEDAIATLARPVTLGRGSAGLLVHQSGGAEHVKRLHYLFADVGGKLVQAWRGWEGQGLTNSSVDTMDVDGDGRSELLYWRFASPDGVVRDWELSVYRWNAERAKVEEVPATSGRPLLFATVARSFPDAGTAAQFLADHPECQGSFVVMRAPERGASPFAVVGITARRSLAVQAARECGGGTGARVIDLGARRR